MLTLFHHPFCPHSRFARLALAEFDLETDLAEERIWERREEFLVSAVGEGTTGGRIYDAHIAEIARQAGARLVATENRRHFTSLLRHGIRVLVSAELVAEIGRAP